MIDRREVVFLDVVAQAGIGDAPLQIDAEAVDHVARPAAAFALHLQRILGGEDAAAAQALGMELEVALLAEQAKAVPDLPGDLQRTALAAACAAACRTGDIHSAPAMSAPERNKRRQYRVMARAFDVTVGAEIRGAAFAQDNVT